MLHKVRIEDIRVNVFAIYFLMSHLRHVTKTPQ